MDLINQIEDLRARLIAEVRSTHDQLSKLGAEMTVNDQALMDHLSQIIADHQLRRNDIVARLSGLVISGPVMAQPSFPAGMPGKSLQ